MDSAELAGHLEEISPGNPYYQLLVLDYNTDRPAWWACNLDGREIDPAVGCPDHAPRDIPGLYRVDCDATPPHPPLWTTDGDHNGYGAPCPQCVHRDLAGQLAEATKTDRCYHWPWRRWKLTHRVARWAYIAGVTAGGGGWYSGGGHDKCLPSLPRLRGKRVYVLGVRRETWRCWLVGRHRRGEEIEFGFCGRCMPWPCCGSLRRAHEPGCTEDWAATAIETVSV